MSATAVVRAREVPANFDARAWTDVEPVLARIYAARGLNSPDDLDHRLQHLHAPHLLSNLPNALARLRTARMEQQRIVIVGDFDADGATGTAIAIRGLRMLGFQDVHYCVPNRFLHGYGLSENLVQHIVESFNPLPDLLITVDNGTSAVSGVAAANRAGMQVLITDHHLAGDELPAALAIINPNLNDDAFPSKSLCGAGVMFYVLLALRRYLLEHGPAPDPELNLLSLLDLVALATVADLVPLDRNNRILVEQGLRRARAGGACLGLRALMAVSGTDASALCAADFGFRIAPRINAAGRLEDISIGIECLLADDPARARMLAEQLHTINAERREIQAEMQDEAFRALEKFSRRADQQSRLPAVMIVADEQWHQGIVGLVASKIAERFHRPAIALAPGTDGWRGSARSIPGFHLRDALARLDALHPGLMQRFGGHAMAAGLSLAPDQLEAFQRAAPSCFAELIDADSLQANIWVDGELTARDYSIELAQAIRFGGPWGQQFPEPLFSIDAEIRDVGTLSGGHLRLRVHGDSGLVANAVWFYPDLDAGSVPKRARLIVQLTADEFRGLLSPKLMVRKLVPV
jgi:single-stranded-DNA-specific exonuclease